MKKENALKSAQLPDLTGSLLLCAVFIDSLEQTDEKIIDIYQRYISKEISVNAKMVGIQKARQEANKKYGKFWRDRLERKKIHSLLVSTKISYF